MAQDDHLRTAAAAVLARQERKAHPRGFWQEGLWWPDPEERRSCCEAIQPTPANKQALDSHCRSQTHVAQLFDVSARALRRAAGLVRRERATAPGAPPGIESLFAAAQVLLRDAKAALDLELGQLAPLLDAELGAGVETLANLLAAIETTQKRLALVRHLVEMCRGAQRAEQVSRQAAHSVALKVGGE